MKKVLLISGGSRGIGAATARLASAEGYAMCVNDVRDRTAAEKLALPNANIVQGDVSNCADVERLFVETERALGPVTHVVNAGGITGQSSRLEACDPDVIAETIAVNLTGTILVCREAVKRMSTKNGGQGGVIINLSSAAATLGSPGEYTWYAASKGGVDSFTIGLAKEVALERVRPSIPMQCIGVADEVAYAILFLLSDRASYITGTSLRVAGGR